MEAKKTSKADLKKFSGLFFNIGLVLSLSFSISAFEWKFYDSAGLVDLGNVRDDFEEMLEILPTEQPPPPPPSIQQPEIIEVPNEEIIEQEIEVNLDVEITEETKIEEIIIEDIPEVEVADEIFTIVEVQPSFPGGWKAFYEYVASNMSYPTPARRMGLEGKVFIQFVVDQNGEISQIEVTRGIGYGCDEEAINVLKNCPKWSPGKQRGQPVKVRMSLPITFKLN